jgi:pimeloyl-ACP methyl ester carboxylesterase
MRVTPLPISFQSRGKTLRGVLYVPVKYTTAVVLLHGFPGDSSGGTDRRARALARAGFLALRFDFTGCGMSGGKHEERLMSGDVKDARAAIDYLCAHAEFDKLVLLGHSTGAIDAALYAHTDKRLTAVIISAGVADLVRCVNYDFTPQQVKDFWMRGHTLSIWPMEWSGKKERIVKAFYDEFFTLTISKAIKKFHKPVLIIHGDKDEAVPVKEAHELYAIANKPKKLVIVKGADHRFTKNTFAYVRALVAFLKTV